MKCLSENPVLLRYNLLMLSDREYELLFCLLVLTLSFSYRESDCIRYSANSPAKSRQQHKIDFKRNIAVFKFRVFFLLEWLSNKS